MTNLITKAKDFYTGHKKLVVVLGILFLILLPQLTTSNYVRGVLARIIVYATIASGLNIINGYSGQSCLGIVGFTCIGAYSGALMSTELGMTFLPSLLCTIVLCAIAGFIVSIPTLTLHGKFLSIITLGFSEMMRLTSASRWNPALPSTTWRWWCCCWWCSFSTGCSTPASAVPGSPSVRTRTPPVPWVSRFPTTAASTL